MDIQKTLEELDFLFVSKRHLEVEEFLLSHIRQAMEEGDDSSYITLLNECIGYYRDAGMYEKSVNTCQKVEEFLKNKGMSNTIPYATTMLNIANAYRAAGIHRESFEYYKQVESLYQGNLDSNDFRYASLNNNLSLLYQEVGDFENACQCLYKALAIVKTYPDAQIELATTHTNLAASLLQLERQGAQEEALEHLKLARNIFEQEEPRDFHYSACLSAMGDAHYQAGRLKEAALCYENALEEIKSNIGENQAYEICLEKLQNIYAAMEPAENLKGLRLGKDYFLTYGKPMLKQFEEYENQMTIGLVGEGSERFGFDDSLSTDHDFGAGFCIFLSEELYEKIGEDLQKAYEKLPPVFKGRRVLSKPLVGAPRVGVFSIAGFYDSFLGEGFYKKFTQGQLEDNFFLQTEEWSLACVTNGEIWQEGSNDFMTIRKFLSYYPRSVWYKKIAMSYCSFSQYGQYNLGRMLEREDYFSAQLILGKWMEETVSLLYLYNRVYSPYYKWKWKGAQKLPILGEVQNQLIQLSQITFSFWEQAHSVPKAKLKAVTENIIEDVAKKFLEYAQTQGFIVSYSHTKDTYLEHYRKELTDLSETQPIKEEKIKNIIALEWEAFDQVENEGGRASCQNNWPTFEIMRKSQYLTWPLPLLESFEGDLLAAKEQGRNLITEKYGRMMESTAPEKYQELKQYFPVLSEERIQIQEAIIRIQVEWMEEFAALYPHLSHMARLIHTQEDEEWDTSYETYLRGEISTYSEDTIQLYGRFIASLSQENKNLAKLIIQNTVWLYGYKSLEEAQEFMKQ